MLLRRNYRCLFLYGLNMGTGTRINLVNKSVSRETSMLAANRLTQIGNERKPAIGRLFWCRIKVGKNAAYKTRQMKLWTALLS